MNKKNCFFCDIYQDKFNTIYENEYWFSRLDDFPISPGHTEIIAKQHISSILDVSEKGWQSLQQAINETFVFLKKVNQESFYKKLLKRPINKKSVPYLEKILKHFALTKEPKDFNLGVNDGKAAGRTISHLHIHIIPRFPGDIKDPRGGVRHILGERGSYQ